MNWRSERPKLEKKYLKKTIVFRLKYHVSFTLSSKTLKKKNIKGGTKVDWIFLYTY